METTRFFDRNQKFKDYRKPYRLGKQIFFLTLSEHHEKSANLFVILNKT